MVSKRVCVTRAVSLTGDRRRGGGRAWCSKVRALHLAHIFSRTLKRCAAACAALFTSTFAVRLPSLSDVYWHAENSCGRISISEGHAQGTQAMEAA